MGQALLHITNVFDQIEKNNNLKEEIHLEDNKEDTKKSESLVKIKLVKKIMKLIKRHV